MMSVGSQLVHRLINYNDASPVVIMRPNNGLCVKGVWVQVLTTFNGGATVDLGDTVTPAGFATSANIAPGVLGFKLDDPSTRGSYMYKGSGDSLTKVYTGSDTVQATIAIGAATQGVMRVYFEVIQL